MKRLLLIALIASLLLAPIAARAASNIATDGEFTSAAANDVCADTGALAGPQTRSVNVIISTNTLLQVTLEYRNASNNGNIYSQLVTQAAGSSKIAIATFDMDNQERFRIIVSALFTAGRAQCTIEYN